MPGIVGYVRDYGDEEAGKFISGMARALEPEEERYQTEMFHDNNAGLGRVGLGILNPALQPVWNGDQNICLVMEGEIYDAGDLNGELGSRGLRLKSGRDAEIMLHLFESCGEEFAAHLDGAFVAAIWDQRSRKLTITNDRLGLFPLYYGQVGGDLIFASGVRALLADSGLSRATDPVAIAQFLTFDHALDDRTLLSGARLLPQAVVLTFSDHQLQMRQYWRPHYPEVFELRTQNELQEKLMSDLRRAVRRQAPGDIPAALLLSGGLDSRVLLALMKAEYDVPSLHTFTWGIPGCDEARIANELAAKTGTRHHFFELKRDYLLRTAENAVRITDGNGNLINLHALATLEEEVQYSKIIYKGFLGDAMMGFALQPPFWADYDPDTAQKVHLSIHDMQGVFYYGREGLDELLTESMAREVGNAVFDSYREGLLRSGSKQLACQRLYFDFTQRVPRMTLNGVEVVRSRAAVRLPFADRDLVDFSCTVPPGYHYQRALMRNAFIQAYPEYAKIPNSDTGLPMISCSRDLFLRAKQFAQWHCNNSGIDWLHWPTRRPYKDYPTWFRTVLKSWVKGHLLSPQALERGYFKPAYVENLVSEHMAGADHTIKLGALLTLEIWHKLFLD